MARPFEDRRDAGRKLARLLSGTGRPRDLIVLALPRGGVPVAAEIAHALGAPLDVFLVRKLGVPGRTELAFGAIASGGVRVLNDEVVRALAIGEATVEAVAERERRELERRESLYREGRPAPVLSGRAAILVDDGLATGASMRAAARAVRRQGPSTLSIAVPVAPRDACAELASEADEVVCALTPEPFYAVGLWYDDFEQTTDEEVRALLVENARERDAAAGGQRVA